MVGALIVVVVENDAACGLIVTDVVAVDAGLWLSVAWKVTTNVWFACACVGVQVAVIVLTLPAAPNGENVIPAGALRAWRLVMLKPACAVAVTSKVSCVPAVGWKGPVGLATTTGGWFCGLVIWKIRSSGTLDLTVIPSAARSSIMICD